MNVEDKTFAEGKHADYAEHHDRPIALGPGHEASAATKLINPLHGLSKERIFSDVDQFCAETGMTEHTDVFRRGALVAQRPEEYEEITELSEDDLFWLRKSTASKWSHPKMLYFTGKCTHSFVTTPTDDQYLPALSVLLPKGGIRPVPMVPVSVS